MPVALLAVLAFVQISPAQTAELRKYRYGKTAAQIEAMGLDAYQRLFEKRTPNADAGFMHGVSYGVFVDAYRENTERRYRRPLPTATCARLLALDKQMRFIGVLFARNAWLASGGGNAFDPESDTLDYAKAERRLYLPFPTRSEVDKKAGDGFFSSMGNNGHGREIEANLAKADRAAIRALGLCRTSRERAILRNFFNQQTNAWAKTLPRVR